MHPLIQSAADRTTVSLPSMRDENRDLFGTLRLEALAAFIAATAAYCWNGFSLPLFIVLFLAPDLAMFGYLAGPRIGAIVYNVGHSGALALALTLAGFFADLPHALAIGLVWLAHIGFDRALGYGLKYPSGFRDTHLGRIDGR